MKGISILGSTGSIGCNSLKVIEHLGGFRVVALGAGRNMQRFAEQIARFKPDLVSVEDARCAEALEQELHALGAAKPKIGLNTEGLEAVATHPDADIVVSAAVGAVGFVPTLRAIEAGKRIALANKETLVIAGELMTRAAERSGAEILPVDSEHNAIHQCLHGRQKHEVRRLILTASGGPFRELSRDALEQVDAEAALRHPTWQMGRKITIDSATLMNKGLEVIEAYWLFDVPPDRIEVVIHPQSIVHSLVELNDGSMLAQLGIADMRLPIQYACSYPDRWEAALPSLDLTRAGRLEFHQPAHDRFPCLGLAFRALQAGGTLPVVLNAANEVAVDAFLEGKLGFTSIPQVIEKTMNDHELE